MIYYIHISVGFGESVGPGLTDGNWSKMTSRCTYWISMESDDDRCYSNTAKLLITLKRDWIWHVGLWVASDSNCLKRVWNSKVVILHPYICWVWRVCWSRFDRWKLVKNDFKVHVVDLNGIGRWSTVFEHGKTVNRGCDLLLFFFLITRRRYCSSRTGSGNIDCKSIQVFIIISIILNLYSSIWQNNKY